MKKTLAQITIIRLGDDGSFWLMNRATKGWAEQGTQYRTLGALLSDWDIALSKHAKDAHSAFIIAIPAQLEAYESARAHAAKAVEAWKDARTIDRTLSFIRNYIEREHASATQQWRDLCCGCAMSLISGRADDATLAELRALAFSHV